MTLARDFVANIYVILPFCPTLWGASGIPQYIVPEPSENETCRDSSCGPENSSRARYIRETGGAERKSAVLVVTVQGE